METDTAQRLHALLTIGKYKAGKLRATGIYSSSGSDVLCAFGTRKLQETSYTKAVLLMLSTGKNVGQKVGI